MSAKKAKPRRFNKARAILAERFEHLMSLPDTLALNLPRVAAREGPFIRARRRTATERLPDETHRAWQRRVGRARDMLKRAADAMPHHEPCVAIHRDWGVPADRCRALAALPDKYDSDVRRIHARMLYLAPIPSALAAALWRVPRPDSRMWRLTDVLSEDDAARLEGWSGDRPPWLQVGVGACTDDCKDCWPAGRGIPLANGALARLAPGQGGRMLALVMCECPTCEGREYISRLPSREGCTACAGTGRRPLVEVAREAEERTSVANDAKERREFPDKLIGIFKRAFRDAMKPSETSERIRRAKRKTRRNRNPRGTDAPR